MSASDDYGSGPASGSDFDDEDDHNDEDQDIHQELLKTHNPPLAAALENLNENKLRDIIALLATSNPGVEAALEAALFISADNTSTTTPDAPSATRKRKASADEQLDSGRATQTRRVERYRVCRNCLGNFDSTTNSDTSCTYHPEYSEADYDGDFWADHDEDCHGNQKQMRI